MNQHQVIEINEAEDPRIAVYRTMREGDFLRAQGLFVAEGENLVLRLAASTYAMHSVLVARPRAEKILHLLPQTVPCYIAAEELLNEIVGFQFHRGVIACGQRPPLPEAAAWYAVNPHARKWVVLCGIHDAENLGVLLRTCAGFGVDAVLLDPSTMDPFYRRVIRVSMGAIFSLPVLRSTDLAMDLDFLSQRAGAELYATVVDTEAIPLYHVTPAAAWAILLGNEHRGLDDCWVARCDHKITLPMRNGIDSLNVATAAGIFLHHFSVPR